jgi:methanogenic corrinoid protein MtbC1
MSLPQGIFHSRKELVIVSTHQKACIPPQVSQTAAQDYARNTSAMLSDVDEAMKQQAGLVSDQVEMMLQNHRHHVEFMYTLFRLNMPELLTETVVWVYIAYRAHGFSPDYFPAALRCWLDAVRKHLPSSSAREIGAVYSWMIDHHEFFLETALSREAHEENKDPFPHLSPLKEQFLRGLLEGNLSLCHNCATGYVTGKEKLQEFYLGVVQPAMVEVGALWQKGKLSVAREHLATAIVTRILASQHMQFISLDKPKGKAIISASANEYHELGARMVADVLDLDGWDTLYVGSNVPAGEALALISNEKPFLVGISVTMPFNLGKAADLIASIRADEALSGTKILVGGRAFSFSPNLWRTIGADASPKDALEALYTANSLWEESIRK